jgi:hypothetical protein
MNSTSDDWLNIWRLKAIASSVSAELRQKFGIHQFYSQEQVLTACDARKVIGNSRAYALGMFANPESIHTILQDYGISEPADEWRRILARKLCYSDTMSIDCSTFDFHHIDSGGHSFDGFSASFGDAGADCGGSSGGE